MEGRVPSRAEEGARTRVKLPLHKATTTTTTKLTVTTEKTDVGDHKKDVKATI